MADVIQSVVEALIGEGVTADTKTPTIKGTYKELTGENLDDAGVEAYRKALRAASNANPDSGTPAAKTVKKVAKKNATPPKTASAKTKAATKTPAKATPKEPKVEKQPLSDVERMKIANQIVKDRAGDDDYPGWEYVKSVVEAGPTGNPIRVIIKCSDPQTGTDGKSVCVKEKEIAAQDVFQTKRCVPCQKRHMQNYRNELAKKRRVKENGGKPKVAKVAKKAAAKAPVAPAKAVKTAKPEGGHKAAVGKKPVRKAAATA